MTQKVRAVNTHGYKWFCMIVGERVRERMQAAGLSQAELARRVGVAQPTIFKLIHSSKKGSAHLHRVARELGTTPAYLSGEVDDPDLDAPEPPPITSEELGWLELIRALDHQGRTALLQIAQIMVTGPRPTVNSSRMSFKSDAE